jgi:hypothetical protein
MRLAADLEVGGSHCALNGIDQLMMWNRVPR